VHELAFLNEARRHAVVVMAPKRLSLEWEVRYLMNSCKAEVVTSLPILLLKSALSPVLGGRECVLYSHQANAC